MSVYSNNRKIATGDGMLREFEQAPRTTPENNCYYNMTKEEYIAFKKRREGNRNFYQEFLNGRKKDDNTRDV